jgi:hypothetical protein
VIWQAIASIIPWETVAALLGAVVLLAGAWWRGGRSGAVARDLRAAKATDAAHERITDAETDLANVHSDADRVRRLADFAREHGA